MRLTGFLVTTILAAPFAGTGCSSPGDALAEGATQEADTSGDGTPTRVPCTDNFGSALAGTFGRLDGIIAAVVPPGHGTCSADRHHVHIQVLSDGATYDVAVNTDGGFSAEKDAPLPGDAWADGWHRGGTLDYVRDFGLHASDFAPHTEAEIDQQIESALASANHVSIYATLYSHAGVHLVHRRANGQDGVLVLDPLSPTARVFAFRFSDQTF
jgi:hypothetical protein